MRQRTVGRDRLLRSYEVVRRTLDESTLELKSSLREAKVLGDTAARKVASESLSSPEQLEAEMADARLVMTDQDPTGQETVEIVHEALISGWDRLQAWLNEDRAFRIWHERLRAALDQWEASSRDEEALLRGVLLVEAEERLKTHPADISPPEHEFLQASLSWRNQRALEKEAQAAAFAAARPTRRARRAFSRTSAASLPSCRRTRMTRRGS